LIKEKIINDVKEVFSNHPNRLKHVYGVRDTALKLGKKYHLDLEILEITALLHDITKYKTKAENMEIIDSYFPETAFIYEQYNDEILHAFSAYVVAIKTYGITNSEILNSILNHTVGRPKMSEYEKVIFISDYIEPNRTYKSCVKVRKIVEESLDKAVYVTLDDSITFFEKAHSKIPKIAYEARQYYKELLEEKMTKIEVVVKALEDINAFDIIVFDTKTKSPFFDYFVISSVTSNRQLQAAISHINQDFAENNYEHPVVEGRNSKSWVLVDCKDIIINIFTREEREYYNLEKMMAGVDQVELKQEK